MIHYRNDVRGSGVDGRALVATARRLLAALKKERAAISLTLVRDEAIRALNRQYRGKDAATDVLSFPLDDTGVSAEEPLLGDVVISVDTARRQAADYDAPLQRELYRLLIHGLLHLLGHDHMRAGERRAHGARRAPARPMPSHSVALRRGENLMQHPADDRRTALSSRRAQPFSAIVPPCVRGIIYATRTQPNMRVHFFIAALVLLAVLVLRLDAFYVVATIGLVALVLSLELMNTAIESIVDLLTVAHHPLAKSAKDAAAGAVLVRRGGLGVRRLFDFLSGAHERRSARLYRVQSVPANIALIVLAVVAIATIFAKAWVGRGSALQGGAVSGHAALAFAAATMLAFFYQKPLAAILAYFVAALVAQSRVEARIHRPFEVLWGAVLGTLTALAIYVLVRPHVVL